MRRNNFLFMGALCFADKSLSYALVLCNQWLGSVCLRAAKPPCGWRVQNGQGIATPKYKFLLDKAYTLC